MPQLWLTYEELADLVRCSSEAAREGVAENGWPRRRCSDGQTRIKISSGLAHSYMLGYAARFGEIRQPAEGSVHELQALAGDFARGMHEIAVPSPGEGEPVGRGDARNNTDEHRLDSHADFLFTFGEPTKRRA
jgi:hypothetical protein